MLRHDQGPLATTWSDGWRKMQQVLHDGQFVDVIRVETLLGEHLLSA